MRIFEKESISYSSSDMFEDICAVRQTEPNEPPPPEQLTDPEVLLKQAVQEKYESFKALGYVRKSMRCNHNDPVEQAAAALYHHVTHPS